MNLINATPAKVVGILALVFLAAQAFTGEQGLLSWRQYSLQADSLEAQKQSLEARAQLLRTRVSRLNQKRADVDLIEETATSQLLMVNPQDLMIKIPPQLPTPPIK